MDDYEEQEAPEETPARKHSIDELPDWAQSVYRDLRNENKERRLAQEAMEATVLTRVYGEDEVKKHSDFIEGMAFEKKMAFLDQYGAKPSATPGAEDTQLEETAQEEPEPRSLGGLVNAPAPGTQVPQELLSIKQIKELHKTDPVKADELIRSGKFQQQTNW